MIAALQVLAGDYGVALADADGFDLEAAPLRAALLAVMAVQRDELRAIVRRLSPTGPNVGERRAAEFALGVVERDMAALSKTVVSTTGEALESWKVA